MTIQELMDRIAGDDLEWAEVDRTMLRAVSGYEVKMATLGAVDQDDKPCIFRLPVEKLKRRTRSSL